MIMTTQGSNASIGGEIPQLDAQVRRGGSQKGSRWAEIQSRDGVGVTLERSYVLTAFVIPNLYSQ